MYFSLSIKPKSMNRTSGISYFLYCMSSLVTTSSNFSIPISSKGPFINVSTSNQNVFIIKNAHFGMDINWMSQTLSYLLDLFIFRLFQFINWYLEIRSLLPRFLVNRLVRLGKYLIWRLSLSQTIER